MKNKLLFADTADALRENGMIYVVVAVLLVIFAGIVFYLVRMDRKISKLEEQVKKS
jgi:CcmD family protein